MIRLNINAEKKVANEILLRKAVRTAYKKTGFKTSGTVNLEFVSAKKSRELNNRWAQNDYPTDVLSFVYANAESWSGQEVADIAICLPIAKKQARAHKVSIESEICLLLVHGILHVLGFDHQTTTSKASFADLQNAIMKEIKQESREFFNA